MSSKTDVLAQLGETSLVLPDLVNRALAANDRIKYCFALLQSAREHAEHPYRTARSLQTEREASGVDDLSLDAVVASSTLDSDQILYIPHATRIHAFIVDDVRQVLKPVSVGAASQGDESDDRDLWQARLDRLLASTPAPDGDRAPIDYVDALTSGDRAAGDSMHLLLMDLHCELNRLQISLAEETVDGAKVYAIADADRPLVAAFMAGVNGTAPLKFDHPGLDTTATRAGDRLVIQNDIGTTEAHVLVVHVVGLTLTVIYADVHAERVRFFQSLLEPLGLQWTTGSVAAMAPGCELRVGQAAAEDASALSERLTRLGSRLVFLIDWNRARKRLGRFQKNADAVAVLKWAADHDVGHRAFLQLGDVSLVGTAMERTASAQIRYGARLDEILGREPAQAFLQAVLTIAADGLKAHRSLRLIQDEIQAELLTHFESREQRVLDAAAEHAMLTAGLAGLVRDAVARFNEGSDAGLMCEFAARAKAWETRADDLVSRSRTLLGSVATSGPLSRLLSEADNVADGLEEAAFLLTLVPREGAERKRLDALRELTALLTSGAQEYVKCLACGQEAQRQEGRQEVHEFLVAVDAVTAFEHRSDACERSVQSVLVATCADFRELHVMSQLAERLGDAADALARSALILRDYILDTLKTRP